MFFYENGIWLESNDGFKANALALLMFEYGCVFIKSKRDNLSRVDINEIKYPFVYKYVYDINDYLACKINSCFSYDAEFEKVKKDIESLHLKF